MRMDALVNPMRRAPIRAVVPLLLIAFVGLPARAAEPGRKLSTTPAQLSTEAAAKEVASSLPIQAPRSDEEGETSPTPPAPGWAAIAVPCQRLPEQRQDDDDPRDSCVIISRIARAGQRRTGQQDDDCIAEERFSFFRQGSGSWIGREEATSFAAACGGELGGGWSRVPTRGSAARAGRPTNAMSSKRHDRADRRSAPLG